MDAADNERKYVYERFREFAVEWRELFAVRSLRDKGPAYAQDYLLLNPDDELFVCRMGDVEHVWGQVRPLMPDGFGANKGRPVYRFDIPVTVNDIRECGEMLEELINERMVEHPAAEVPAALVGVGNGAVAGPVKIPLPVADFLTCLEYGSGIDQMNLPNLVMAELISRRVQLIDDAHSGTGPPPWEGSEHFLGSDKRARGIAALLSAHVASRLKDESEVDKQMNKTCDDRKLGRGAAAGDNQAKPQAQPKK